MTAKANIHTLCLSASQQPGTHTFQCLVLNVLVRLSHMLGMRSYFYYLEHTKRRCRSVQAFHPLSKKYSAPYCCSSLVTRFSTCALKPDKPDSQGIKHNCYYQNIHKQYFYWNSSQANPTLFNIYLCKIKKIIV